MTPAPRANLTAGWLGFTLASLFFYPLASALDGDPYYLQWQPAHSVEAAMALAGLSLVAALVLRPVLARRGRGATLALGALAVIPLLSLGAGLSRQLPIGDLLRSAWTEPFVRYGVPGVVAAGALLAFALRPQLAQRVLRRSLLILSPVGIVVVIGLARAGLREPVALSSSRTTDAAAPAPPCPSVLALLFDEFSFAYLHVDGAVGPGFPHLRAFAAHATNYQAVRSPGTDTMVAVPGYLAGRAFDAVRPAGDGLHYEAGAERGLVDPGAPGGLLHAARRAGLSPELVGYYFAYCQLSGAAADACRSLSFYNTSTVDRGFSLWHPILTTLIVWPHQFPTGLLKNPAFAAHQRALVEATTAWLSRPLDADRPVLRFAHFSIPHLPFAFTEEGYDPPVDPLRQTPDDAYVRQLHFADRRFGEIVARMQRDGVYDRTTIVFFSDHGFRSGGQETDVRHVPFLVKWAGQRISADVRAPMAGEQLLRDIVQRSCTARPWQTFASS